MATAQRAKGSDVTLTILMDGQPQVRIDTISSCTATYMQEILEAGYLGEDADRYDAIYKGMQIDIEGHCNGEQYLELADSIANKARRRSGAAIRIDVVATFNFPNGDFPTLALIDLHFGEIPIEIAGRQDHVKFSLTGKCSNSKRL